MKGLKYEGVVKLKIFWSLKRLEAGLNGFRIKKVHYDKFELQIIREPPNFNKPNAPLPLLYKKPIGLPPPPHSRAPSASSTPLIRPSLLSSSSAARSGENGGWSRHRRGPSILPLCFPHPSASHFSFQFSLTALFTLHGSFSVFRRVRRRLAAVRGGRCYLFWFFKLLLPPSFSLTFPSFILNQRCSSSSPASQGASDDGELWWSTQIFDSSSGDSFLLS